MHIANLPKVAVACLLPLAFACSGADDAGEALSSQSGILGYIPADTPYAFAAAAPLPDDVRDKLAESNREIGQAYSRMLKTVFDQVERKEDATPEEVEVARRASAVLDAVAELLTPEGMPEAGIDRNSTAALYGVGLLPVLRVTLSDAALFENTFAKLEAEAGAEMETASLDGYDYRYTDSGEVRFIVAANDDQLVVTAVPQALEDEPLRAVLGITRPARNIVQAGTLAALADKYDYQAYGVGFLDIERIVATFVDEPAGIDRTLLGLAEYDASELSDVCRAEIRSFAQIAPRFVTGYTDISGEHLSSNSVIELRADLAAGLAALTAPVPGLGGPQDGLLSFGMSIDALAAREFYSARLDALEADPYECELFADIQEGVAGGRQMLNQPIPPIVYSFHGFLAVIDNIAGLDIGTGTPPTEIDMRFLVATENAEGLLAMGAMFSPEIAALDLKPDSKPVQVPLPAMGQPVQDAWVAMSTDALAISVGNGGGSKLEGMLAAAPAQPSPFMSVNMDAARYYSFMGEAMSVGGDGDDEAAEMVRATSEMMNTFSRIFSRIIVDVQFTERGIEIPSTVLLK